MGKRWVFKGPPPEVTASGYRAPIGKKLVTFVDWRGGRRRARGRGLLPKREYECPFDWQNLSPGTTLVLIGLATELPPRGLAYRKAKDGLGKEVLVFEGRSRGVASGSHRSIGG